MDENFIEYVDNGDMLSVAVYLKNSIIFDKSCRDFEEHFAYAVKRMPELLQPHNGDMLDYNVADEQELVNQLSRLVRNFSVERVSYICYMCEKLYPDKAGAATKTIFKFDNQQTENSINVKEVIDNTYQNNNFSYEDDLFDDESQSDDIDDKASRRKLKPIILVAVGAILIIVGTIIAVAIAK